MDDDGDDKISGYQSSHCHVHLKVSGCKKQCRDTSGMPS